MADRPDDLHLEPDDFATPEAPLGPNELALESLLIVHYNWSDADLEAQLAAVMGRVAKCSTKRHLLRPQGWLVAAAIGITLLGAGIFYHFNARSGPRIAETQPAGANDEWPQGPRIRVPTAETRTIPLGDFGTMQVQGPADVELLSNMRARLNHGRIRVRIDSPSGRGFVAETDRAKVTDLGTEFGMDATNAASTGVVVFQGVVNLAIPTGPTTSQPHEQRLVQGDGVVVNRTGRLDRWVAIVVDDAGMFTQPGEPLHDGTIPLIADVWDNLPVTQSKKHYEIRPRGFKEDVLCYVDRPTHEWNGMDERGLPSYLIGADYIKTYNNYKYVKGVSINVMLSRPARLFVFLDRRVEPPEWLKQQFRLTGDSIGMDEGAFVYRLNGTHRAPTKAEIGPGKSIDGRFFVWEQVVQQAGVVTLGENGGRSRESGMYGIAAVELNSTAP